MINKTKTSCNIFLLLIFLFTVVEIEAQEGWQQRVEYDISVRLDDQNHSLSGHEKFNYFNNSNQSLSFIYIHLYANAYKNRKTALCQELVADNNTKLYFATDDDHGYIDSLHFKVNGTDAKFELLDKNIDIGILYLNTPIAPHTSAIIETPFYVKIPGNFSRLSHVGQSYQICQWYPKPALYDSKGWHQMVYHDQGEFYSEFGSYKVAISLPNNYIVGASGILQEKEEQEFLDRLAADSSDDDSKHIYFPPSSKDFKTITYIQDSIHDFAWFADKRFIVRKSAVTMPYSKRVVTTYALFTGYDTDLWKHGTDFINRSLAFYSRKMGDYPYQVYTAIDGTLSAGGGMEYPLLTNINSPNDLHELDIIITHEVGHSWFYGILASNERDEPYLDEGINSYYENLYNNLYYPKQRLYHEFLSNRSLAKLLDIYNIKDSYKNKLFYLYSASIHRNQAIDLNSQAYSNLNYGSMIYSKTPLVLDYIANFMGQDAFATAMKSYYTNFQFKHPSSLDFQNELQKYSKQNLSTLFDQLIHTPSYQRVHIKSIKSPTANTIEIKVQSNPTNIPFPIQYINANETVTQWYDSHRIIANNDDLQTIRLMGSIGNINAPFDDETFALNHSKFKKVISPVAIRLIGLVRSPNQRQLNILPAIGWNQSDKFMLGALFYSSILPAPKFDYQVAALFATGSLRPVGVGRITLHCFPKKIDELRLSLKVQSFSYNDYYSEAKKSSKFLAFYNAQPSIKILFKNQSVHSQVQKSLTMMSSIVYQEFRSDFDPNKKVTHWYQTASLQFDFNNRKKINPYHFSTTMQASSDFASLSAQANYSISYFKAKCSVDIRLFAAYLFFIKDIAIDSRKGLLPPNRSLTLSSNPLVGNYAQKMNEDFSYESIYLDRSGQTKVLSHQVFTNKEGGFKSMIGTGLGNSNRWILSIGISASLPKRIPIRPFVTLGTGYLFNYKTSSFKPGVFIAEAGFSIVALKDIFEIHFPLLVTNNIKENQKFNFGIDKFYERITFTLDLNLLNPFEKLRNIKF